MVIKQKDSIKLKVGQMNINQYLISENFSGALIELNGDHGKLYCKNEDRIYFIFFGNGTFEVDGKLEKVSEYDLIFVPKNTTYDIKGNLKFFMICSPKFNAADDVYID